MDEDEIPLREISGYWRAQFDSKAMPGLPNGFSTEEHLRILLYRNQQLEKRTKILEKVILILFMMSIFISTALAIAL